MDLKRRSLLGAMLSVLPKNSILRPGLEDFIGKKLVC